MNESSSGLAALVNKLPDPDEQGMLSNIDKQVVENVITEIHKGGRDSIVGLIDMLVEPGKGDDVKPRYALHCLAVYVCKLQNPSQQQAFTTTLASQLGDNRPKAVQSYIIRQLQIAGGKEVASSLGNLLCDEELCQDAAQALVAIGDGAAEQFRDALPKAAGKCRLTIVQNLGVVRDARSANLLRQFVNDTDRDTKLAAAWALANIADTGSIDTLLKAADTENPYERIKLTQACLVLAEKLLTAGKKNEAAKIYTYLRDTRTDASEKYVRDAAMNKLAAIGER
jgi:hypothetical protein